MIYKLIKFIDFSDFLMLEMSDKISKTIYNINPPLNSSVGLLEKNMPWIIALIVGCLTIGSNLLISYHLRNTNKKILLEQLSHNKEIALEQIKNSQINSQKEFNKTVLSGNRQSLINQIREIVSLILTKVSIIYLKEQIDTKDYDELKLLITRVELLLTPNEDINIIKSLKNLDTLCFEILSQGKNISFLENGIELLKDETLKKIQMEWYKVTKGI